jgi:hypothetical protein
VTVEREDVTEIGFALAGDDAAADSAYVEAALIRPSRLTTELHETPTGILTGLVEEAVRIEGPVHIDEVIDRIRDAWGLKRAGGRVQQAVETAIDVAVRTGRIERAADFLALPDAPVRVRDRSATASASLRRADRLPPEEIAAAVLQIVRLNFGATREQAVQAAARAFGIKATSAVMRSALEAEVDRMVEHGALTAQAGVLMVTAESAPADPS